jgi:hypothetical protein
MLYKIFVVESAFPLQVSYQQVKHAIPSLIAFLCSLTSFAQTTEGFVSLFNGRDLTPWTTDEPHWKVEQTFLTATSDGKSISTLAIDGRDFGNFELQFDLRVKRGAASVKMRGPGKGPLGVELEVGESVVRWLVNGSPLAVVSNVKAGEWNAYRIVSKGDTFDVFQNGQPTTYTIVAGHQPPRGKLAFTLPAGAVSEIELSNLRIRE